MKSIKNLSSMWENADEEKKKTLKSIFEVAVKREKICEAVCENIQIGSSSSSSSTIIDMIIFFIRVLHTFV